MADLTITPNTQTLGGSASTIPVTPPQPKSAPAPETATSGADVSDTISLSGIIQNSEPNEKPPLSENDAQSQSAKLRQQLSSVSLSGTARQNQAIVALLRN